MDSETSFCKEILVNVNYMFSTLTFNLDKCDITLALSKRF